MNIAYLSLLALSIISCKSNAMEQDLESEPILVSNKEAIYFKMPKDMYTTNITSLNLSDEDKSELAKIRSIYDERMIKIKEYLDNQTKKISKSRFIFERFLCAMGDMPAYSCLFTKKIFCDTDMEYYMLLCRIDLGRCCRPDIREFFHDKAHVESLLSEIPRVTIMSKREIDEIQKADEKKMQQQIEIALKEISEKRK